MPRTLGIFPGFLTALLSAGVVVLSSCGDDNSSDGGEEPITSSESRTLDVDEGNRTLTWTSQDSRDLCIHDNGSYTWETVNLGESTESARYEFHGDTLVLYSLAFVNGKQETYGHMYTGGEAGKVYGTWKDIFCEFDPQEKKTYCASGDIFATRTITLSKGKMTVDIEYDFERYAAQKSGNLVQSQLTGDILRALNGTSELYIPGAFVDDSARFQSLIREYKITTSSQTKNSIQFKMNGSSYSIKYNEAEESIAKDGSGKLNRIVKLTLSTTKAECNLDYERTFMEESLCKNENGDFLDVAKEKDAKGNTFEYAVAYLIDNQEEFEKCITTIVSASQGDDDNSYNDELN